MAALESEFPAFQNPLQDIFQEFGLTVLKPLFVCHNNLHENRSPADQQGRQGFIDLIQIGFII
jgi:hypothetical protein